MSHKKVRFHYDIPTHAVGGQGIVLSEIHHVELDENNNVVSSTGKFNDNKGKCYDFTMNSDAGDNVKESGVTNSFVKNKEVARCFKKRRGKKTDSYLMVLKSENILKKDVAGRLLYRLPSHIIMPEGKKNLAYLQKMEPTAQLGCIGFYGDKRRQTYVVKAVSDRDRVTWLKLMDCCDSPYILPLITYQVLKKKDKTANLMLMEKCDCDLWDLIQNTRKVGRRLSQDRSIAILECLAHGMKCISESVFISHGDIKPENVFISGSRTFIADFDTLEVGGSKCTGGTVEYYAFDRPSTGVIDSSDDVYAFGLVATGVIRTRVCPTDEELAMDVKDRHKKWMSELNDKAVPELANVISNCFLKRGERPSFEDIYYTIRELVAKGKYIHSKYSGSRSLYRTTTATKVSKKNVVLSNSSRLKSRTKNTCDIIVEQPPSFRNSRTVSVDRRVTSVKSGLDVMEKIEEDDDSQNSEDGGDTFEHEKKMTSKKGVFSKITSFFS